MCRAKSFVFMPVAAIILAAAVQPVFAADEPNAPKDLFEMSIEELTKQSCTVSGASKYEQNVSDAPAYITIVTAEEIRKYGHKTLGDVLQSVPGFFTTYDRNYSHLGVRGFRRPGDYDTRILLLINGHRVNDNIYDSASWDTMFPLDVDLIERVEVIRGPGSSLYGSNALLAVVNVITKDAKAIKGLELSGELASFDTQKGRISYGHAFNETDNLLVSATGFDSDGQKLKFDEFSGSVSNDDDKFHNFFVRSDFGNFSFLATHVAREKGIPTAPWGTDFGNPRTRTNDDTTLVGLTYTRTLTDDFAVRAKIDYHHYDYDGRWAYDDGDPYINKDYAKGRRWENELQFIATPIENHKITWGAEGRYNTRQGQKNWDSDVYLDDDRHSKNWGIYIQDEWAITDDITFVGGIRHDYYDTFGHTTNPRLALIYKYTEDTTLKLLYGKAFRAPNPYELYYNDGDSTTKAAHSLSPETIKTYEAVLEQKISGNLSGIVSVFHYKIRDVLEQAIDPADDLLVFSNSGNIEATGIDTELRYKWESGLKGRAGYSFIEAKDTQTDSILVNSPRHLAKLNVIAPLIKDRLFAGVELQYTSRVKTLADDKADDFLITNLTLTYENVVKGLELSVSVYNLFDVDYGHPGASEHLQDVIPQDGTSYRVKLTYRF